MSIPSAQAAFHNANAFRAEVVLLDVGLPGVSGYEVGDRIREMPETKCAVLVAQTGWGQDEDRRRFAEAASTPNSSSRSIRRRCRRSFRR